MWWCRARGSGLMSLLTRLQSFLCACAKTDRRCARGQVISVSIAELTRALILYHLFRHIGRLGYSGKEEVVSSASLKLCMEEQLGSESWIRTNGSRESLVALRSSLEERMYNPELQTPKLLLLGKCSCAVPSSHHSLPALLLLQAMACGSLCLCVDVYLVN